MAGEAQTSFFWRELSCQITRATLVKRVTTHSYSKHVYLFCLYERKHSMLCLPSDDNLSRSKMLGWGASRDLWPTSLHLTQMYLNTKFSTTMTTALYL